MAAQYGDGGGIDFDSFHAKTKITLLDTYITCLDVIVFESPSKVHTFHSQQDCIPL